MIILLLLMAEAISATFATGALLLGTSIIGTYISQQLIKEESWCYYRKYVFGEEYTNMIDDMLMKDHRALVNDRLLELGKERPAVGDHYFYYDPTTYSRWLYRICFTKKEK